jgi:hypothetical protein
LPSLPEAFELNQKEIALLWGWLTNRFPVKTSLLKTLGEKVSSKKDLILLTRAQIATLVTKALSSNNETVAHQLFEMTAPSQTRKEYTRRSMRIGQGTYLKLLQLKIKKDTSFSDVIIEVLKDPMIRYIDEIEEKYGGVLSDKIEILRSKTVKWNEITPDSRSRNVEYNFIRLEDRPTSILEHEDIREILPELAKTLGYIQNLPYDMAGGPDSIYTEFQAAWEESLETELKAGINMEVNIDPESDELSFRIFGYAKTKVDQIKLEELYLKNDYQIDGAIEKYCTYPYGEELEKELEKYEKWSQKFSKIVEKYRELSLGFFVDLAKYRVDVKSDKEFEIVNNQDYFDETENRFRESRKDILRELDHYEYMDFNELIRKVMMTGNETDYRQVKQLFKIGKAEDNFRKVYWFGKNLIQSEIAKYPVISYYAPNEIIPLLSVILNENNLYDLINQE